jgi:hypothetical protein
LTASEISDIIRKLFNILFPPPLHCGENQEFETDALRALLNCRIRLQRNMRIKYCVPGISLSLEFPGIYRKYNWEDLNAGKPKKTS